MYTPVNPSFTIYKWGLRGVKIILACFRDDTLILSTKNEVQIMFYNSSPVRVSYVLFIPCFVRMYDAITLVHCRTYMRRTMV